MEILEDQIDLSKKREINLIISQQEPKNNPISWIDECLLMKDVFCIHFYFKVYLKSEDEIDSA